MMYHIIEDAPDGQRILGQFATEEQARECFDGFDHKSPDCKYYIAKALTEVW